MAIDNIEKLLTTLLEADAGVGAIAADRIYPLVVPQDAAMPAITYQKTSGNWQIQMSGPHNMSQERFRINCWAETYSEVKGLADAVRAELNGYDTGNASVDVHIITLENETDLINVNPEVRGLQRYGRAMDFIIWYKDL
jgi:hypothetical protein